MSEVYCGVCAAHVASIADLDDSCGEPPGCARLQDHTAIDAPSMRQRLARAHCQVECTACKARDGQCAAWKRPYSGSGAVRRQYCLDHVDAILTELQEPSEGMVDAATLPFRDALLRCSAVDPDDKDAIRFIIEKATENVLFNVIQHVRDGGS